MTAKLRDILNQISNLVETRSVKSISDDDFIARVEAICLMRNIYDVAGLDESPVIKKMKSIYPEFSKRINVVSEIHRSVPLIKALHRFIHGRSSAERRLGPAEWNDSLIEYCRSVSEACHEGSTVTSSLRDIDLRNLSDAELLAWCEVADELPRNELRKRSGNSNRMRVEYLRALAFSEFARIREAREERLLREQLKNLTDDIIADILPIRISQAMTVSTLHALEIIYNLRSNLAFEAREPHEVELTNFQCHRLEQITKALTRKYSKSQSLNEKIEILERIETIERNQEGENSQFAFNESSRLRNIPNLTKFQKLRLSWISEMNVDDCDMTVAALLPLAEGAFDIATLSLVGNRCSAETRNAVIEKFKEIFRQAVSHENISELQTLLPIAADWAAIPSLRPVVTELSEQIAHLSPISPQPGATVTSLLSIPEGHLLPITLEIYSRIDALSGRYSDYHYIPA